MADTTVQKPQGDSTWFEPDSQAANSAYPHVKGFYSDSGHFVEMDDTPEFERIRLQHRIGNYTEIQSDGTEIHKVIGDNYEIVVKNNHVLIKGYCTVTIQGDSKLSVEGDVYQNIEGNVYQNVEGAMDCVVTGELNVTSESDINITAGGSVGQINLNAPFGVHIDSDVTVSGSISSTGFMYSAENVMAGKKVYGHEGLTTIGGILCGFPDVGPLTPGTIRAAVAVEVPLVNAIILNDVVGSTALMRMIYTIHDHLYLTPAPSFVLPAPAGPLTPTSLPTLSML
jgi:hypothetical protein